MITRAPPGARFFAPGRHCDRGVLRLLQFLRPAMLDDLVIGFDRALRTLSGHATSSRPTPGANLAETDAHAGRTPSRGGPDARQSHRRNLRAGALRRAGADRAQPDDPAAVRAGGARGRRASRVDPAAARRAVGSRVAAEPVWYGGAFAIGILAGAASDAVNLGFVVETERQVEDHLTGHMEQLPPADARSRAIVEQMRDDEARHGAHGAGGRSGGAAVPGQAPDARRRGRDARGRVPGLSAGRGFSDFFHSRSALSRAARTAFAIASAAAGVFAAARPRAPRATVAASTPFTIDSASRTNSPWRVIAAASRQRKRVAFTRIDQQRRAVPGGEARRRPSADPRAPPPSARARRARRRASAP